jgi:DNA-binding beta-propeller fold protein YncE
MFDGYVIGSKTTHPRGLAFKTDGTEMYVVSYGDSNVHQWTLSTGFDVSTASFTRTLDTTRADYGQAITFKPAGTKMYVTEDTAEAIR